MNSQEIVNYVMNTPHNTNPVILKSMIDANSTGGGGITSWNDLTDKPFDSNHIVFFNGENFAWNGEVVVDEYEAKYMKILDASLSKDEVIGYSCVYNNNGNIESFEIGKNDISEYENGSLSIFMDDIYIIYSDCNNYGAQFTRGVWTKCINDDCRLLKLEKEDIKKIDAKFLPENVAMKEDIPEVFSGKWEDLENRPFGAGATKITVTIHQKEQVPVITVDGDEKYIWNPVETQFMGTYIKILDYGVSFDAVKAATLNGELLKEEWSWSQIDTNDQYTETDAIIAVYANEVQLVGGGQATIFEKGTYVNKNTIERGEVVIPENKTLDPKYLPSGTGGGKRTTAYIKGEYLWKDKECTEKFTKAELMEIGVENLIIENRPEWDNYALYTVYIPYCMSLTEDYAIVTYGVDTEVYSAEYVSTGA